MAPGLGVEPRLTGPEPVVLPLDDPGIQDLLYPTKTDIAKDFLDRFFDCYFHLTKSIISVIIEVKSKNKN